MQPVHSHAVGFFQFNDILLKDLDMIESAPPRTAAELAAARLHQTEFFARANDGEPLRRLFDYLPGLRFFVKDHHGRLVAVNEFFALRRGDLHPESFLGRSDWRIHPPLIARRLREDDLRIMANGERHHRPSELLHQDGAGRMDWGRTSKLPMFDSQGKVFGIIGVSRPSPPPPMIQSCLKAFQAATRFLLGQRHRPVSAGELAAQVDLPERRLQALIHEAYGVSPRELSLHVRFLMALVALRDGTQSIGDVALDHGFSDQSDFSRKCRRLCGLSPRQIRNGRWRCP
jgi:AraC-like DNA-binding protein